jgi:hypothetical protein
VNQGSGQDDIPIDPHFRERRLEFIDNFEGKTRNAAQVIRLTAALEAFAGNIANALEARLAKRMGPRLDCFRSQRGVGDLIDLRQVLDDRGAYLVRYRALEPACIVIHPCPPLE